VLSSNSPSNPDKFADITTIETPFSKLNPLLRKARFQ
jgi:hypothetical protein